MAAFVVSFDKDKDYSRFLVTNVLTNLTRGMVCLELLEEISPISRKLTIPDQGESVWDSGGSNIENIIHATAVVHPDNLPLIIESLKGIYDRYLAELSIAGGDPIEQTE